MVEFRSICILCTGGVHIDEITGEQIREIVDAVEKMGEEIAQDLR